MGWFGPFLRILSPKKSSHPPLSPCAILRPKTQTEKMGGKEEEEESIEEEYTDEEYIEDDMLDVLNNQNMKVNVIFTVAEYPEDDEYYEGEDEFEIEEEDSVEEDEDEEEITKKKNVS